MSTSLALAMMDLSRRPVSTRWERKKEVKFRIESQILENSPPIHLAHQNRYEGGSNPRLPRW